MYDLIIIGGAAVGCSAAIYAARRELNFKVITENVGGEVALSGKVNNWPGIIDIDGFDLAQKFAEHAKSYGVQFDEGWKVAEIKQEKNYHVVVAKNYSGETKEYQTKSVIIGTGIHPRELNVPGEKELKNKGVTYCTVCDGPLYKNKVTVTVGSGNSALESALMMAGIASKVYVLSKFADTPENRGGFPRGENILIDKLKAIKDKVQIIYSADTTAIEGEGKVTGVTYKDTSGASKHIDCDAVMVHVGMIPNSQFVPQITKNPPGEIVVDNRCRTNIPGIFAAGDVTDVAFKQIGIATGQGILATLAAIEYINRWE